MKHAWWLISGAFVVAFVFAAMQYQRPDDTKQPIGDAVEQRMPESPAVRQDTSSAKSTEAARPDKSTEPARPDTSTKAARLDTPAEDVRPRETTGAGIPSGLTSEQRDKIRGLVAGPREARVDTSEFMPKVGNTVPPYVLLHRLPAELADIMGGYHGSDYLIVLDQMVIVDPKSRRIVAVISGV